MKSKIEKKKIAVFTGGGDCPGLNMAIKAVAQYAMIHYGWEVIGIKNALNGILGDDSILNKDGELVSLTRDFPFDSFVREGGTFLGAYRKMRTKAYEKVKNDEELVAVMLPYFIKNIKEFNIDGIIATGGDGTMFMINYLCEKAKIPFVGIPKTIDNDTPGTEISIGFSSAVDACISAMDNIYWTAKSHHRAICVEVMGRNTGHLAMHSGLASCADVILVPEIPYKIDNIEKHLKDIMKHEGRDYFIIVVAEGAGAENSKPLPKNYNSVSEYIAKELNKRGIEIRSDVLGYLQRGGQANGYDRMLAAELSTMAVDLMANGETAVIAGMKDGKPTKIPLKNVCNKETRGLDLKSPIIRTAKSLGIYIGELK